MASLQEQLLKAGLSTKQKARQANSDKRKKNKQKRSGVEIEATLQEKVKQDLAKSQQEKQARDNALNAEKKQQLEKKEQKLRILQILQHHQIKQCSGESEYNYTFGSKIKKLYLDTTTHRALVNGRLALCGQDDTTYIVTAETAAKLAELDSQVILLQNERVAADQVDEDDPYADYQIPDDLMW
ncbi:DUF2058 domain-containing protein [Colwelliaceae bacterium 6441]